MSKFLQKILTIIAEQEASPSYLAKVLKTSRQRVQYNLKKAEKKGLVTSYKIGKIKIYKLTEQGKNFVKKLSKNFTTSESEIPKLRFHNLGVKIKYFGNFRKENLIKSGWKKKKFRNWEGLVLNHSETDATLVLTPKSLWIFFHNITLLKREDFYGILISDLLKKLSEIKRYLWTKFRIEIDMDSIEPLRQEIAEENEKIKDLYEAGALPKKGKYTVIFPWNALTPFGELKTNAKAWVDFSQTIPERETDDMNYARDFVLEPIYIKKTLFISAQVFAAINQLSENMNLLNPVLSELSRQIKLHLEVMNEMKETLKQIREGIKKLSEKR